MATRHQRVQIFRQTVAYGRRFPKPQLIRYIPPQGGVLGPQLPYYDPPGVIEVRLENCLNGLAREVAQFGSDKTALLNMASFTSPGGGVTRGARAQEEVLCMVSNLYEALEKAKFSVKPSMYPLVNGFTVKGVTFFLDENYQLLPQPIVVDVLTISAIRLKGLYDTLRPDQERSIKHRVQQLMDLCLGYECLVLSAFGCGAYNNPPAVVAEAFREILIDQGYLHRFKKVVFSILDDHNSNDNYRIFLQILTPGVTPITQPAPAVELEEVASAEQTRKEKPCVQCGEIKERSDYTVKQWRKTRSRCRTCLLQATPQDDGN